MAAEQSAAGGARRTRQRERQAAGCAPATGLSAVRDELERQPRDPFAVDRERAADALSVRWGSRYSIRPCEGGYEAVRRHGAGVSLTAETPDELDRAMTGDSRSW